MNRSTVSRRISSILDDIQRLTNALYAMNTTDLQRYPDNYEVLSIDAALRAEGIACRLRHLIYASTTTPKTEYLTSAANTQGISVRCKDGVFEVTLPALLPKRKMWQSGEYLLEPLGAALTQYARGHPLPRFRHCLIAFSHIYDQELPERRIRDYDNLELKQFLDVAASFILTDDSGLLCDAYNTTEPGEADCTRISIMDSAHFPKWLAERQAALQSITDL